MHCKKPRLFNILQISVYSPALLGHHYRDLSTSPYVDLAGASMLLKLQTELLKRGIRLGIVEAHAPVRDLLRAEGLDEKIGPINRFTSVADLVENFQQQSKTGRVN